LFWVIREDRQRSTISESDYVQYRDNKKGKVLGIFAHISLQGIQRVFFYICPFHDEPLSDDRVLNLPRLRLNNGERIIVGLPGIVNKRLYLLGVGGTPLLQSGREIDMHEETLIHCSWEVSFF
jgi:hypothetical protein